MDHLDIRHKYTIKAISFDVKNLYSNISKVEIVCCNFHKYFLIYIVLITYRTTHIPFLNTFNPNIIFIEKNN